MLSIITLIIILLIAWIYLYVFFKKLNVIDMFLISNILFFNLYTLITLLKSEFTDDPIVIMFFNIYLFGILFLVLLLLKVLIRKKTLNKVEFLTILDVAASVSDRKFLLLLLIPIMFIYYYFFTYSIIFRTLGDSPALYTYGIIMGSFILPLIYTLLLISVSKYNQINIKRIKYIYLIIMIMIMLYLLLYSRREFILGILIVLVSVYTIKKENIFSLKKIPLMMGGLFVVILASNIYQNIRLPLMMYSQTHELKFDKAIYEYMFDFDSSSNTLTDRMAIAKFAYISVEKGLESNEIPLGGEIILNNFLSAIPSVLYPNKKPFSEDSLIAHKLNIKNTDYPTNIFISFFLDFKYLSLVLLPLFLYIIIFLFLKIINNNYKDKILYLLIIGQFLYLIFNVESSLSTYFLFLRNMIILIILFKTISIVNKFFPQLRRSL